ncbi:MAG: hypothetical protein HY074_08365 [Deltaproteobacteria bacterium]|nr:hypothetical protein [Deltaproteobacteria bacterium]
MKPIRLEENTMESDFFTALNLPRRKLCFSERQVYIELHPSNSGPLAKLAKAPVILAQQLVVTVTPEESCPAGARIEAEIDVNGLEVVSPDISEADKSRIKQKIRSQLLQGDDFPWIRYQVNDVSVQRDGSSILAKGLLTLHGRAVEQYIRFKKTGANTYEANIQIAQTTFGLVPLTAMMGGLRSDDRIAIRCVVYLGK